MILHCSKKLAAKLPDVSPTRLEETSPIGSWHGHLLHLDRRQCLMLCHDSSRAVLFLPGMRKEHFAELDRWFRLLFTATLAALEIPDSRIKQAKLLLGPLRCDAATDRSVQSALNIARRDLEAMLERVPNVMNLDPVAVSARLCHRPTWIRGKAVWPDKLLRELIAERPSRGRTN